MKKNKKALPNHSDFHKKHDPLILGGEEKVFDGWVNAGVECYEKFRGNASAYAKASVNGFAVSQTETTIRLYVGAIVRGLRKHKSKAELVAAYDAVYESREINTLMKLVKGSGQRKNGRSKKSTQDTVALTKRKASAFVTKFVPANKRDEAMESLGF